MSALKQRLGALLAQPSIWRLALVVSLLAILVLATIRSGPALPVAHGDKINHVLAFVELTLLAHLGWPAARAWYAALWLLGYGLLIELAQAQLHYRSFGLDDLVADLIGIMLGLTGWVGLDRLKRTLNTSSAHCDNGS